MARKVLTQNIAGRVAKYRSTDFLAPLYEAMSNSIHAIAARPGSSTIDIEILRQPRQRNLPDVESSGELPITGFRITDDGVGFDEANMGSFLEADSAYKAAVGGKGVGRFSWLKFFEQATVESVFTDLGKVLKIKRTFTFSMTGIEEDDLVDVTSGQTTTVSLTPLRFEYETRSARSLDDVCMGVIEHFIAYLVTHAMPAVTVRDGSATRNIGTLYRTSIGRHEAKGTFEVRGHVFDLIGIRFFLGGAGHTGFLCGDKRVSDRIQLGKRDPFFKNRFTDPTTNTSYAFHVYVQSPYLDHIVHDDREGFRFPEPGTLDATEPDAVFREDVAAGVLGFAHDNLAEELSEIKRRNLETVSQFVSSDGPQYRGLVKRHSDAIASIHDHDKVKIDEALRRIQFDDELKTKAEIGTLLRQADEIVGGSDAAEWQERSTAVLERISEEGKASLATYIVKRKHILEVLQRRMQVGSDGYAREAAIHQLVFPMRNTSDDVTYEQQNLWILDERLSYHYYLASDKPLSTIPPAESTSQREPDIIVFNRPIALYDRSEDERLESVVLIEFKRPGRMALESEKHPVQQLQEYIELILAGRAMNRKGRPIAPTNSMYFFGYVVCELDETLKRILKRTTMKETPDGRGMFGFFEGHRAYIEVISYDKLLDDARKRNRILFEKLQLPAF